MILAASLLSLCWGFVTRHPGLMLVLIGVGGEVACDWKEMVGRLAWAKKISAMLLVIGLAVEFWESAKLDNEVADTKERTAIAIKEASQANERASTNELAAKQFEIQLNETKTQLANAEVRLNESVTNLQNANLPMDIGEEFSFASALKPLAGMWVELRTMADGKSQKTAELLRSTFAMAGWPVINIGLIGDIGEDGIVIGYGRDEPSQIAANMLLKLLTERGVPSVIIDDPMGVRVRGVPTNTIIVAVCQRPSQLKASLMVVMAKEAIINDQEPKIWSRISEIAAKRYPDSNSLAAAQTEYNDLNSRIWKLQNDQKALSQQEQNMYGQIDKEESGTNATTPGIHVHGGSVWGNGNPFVPATSGTNSPKVFMYGVKINPEPLQ